MKTRAGQFDRPPPRMIGLISNNLNNSHLLACFFNRFLNVFLDIQALSSTDENTVRTCFLFLLELYACLYNNDRFWLYQCQVS